MKKLSKRVHDLHLTITAKPTCYTVTPKSLALLLHPTEKECLFPNIRTLSIHVQVAIDSQSRQGQVLTFLRTLIRPCLTSLDLLLDGTFYASQHALDALMSCSHVRSLRTRVTPLAGVAGTPTFVFPVISEFRSLEIATINDCPWELLTRLARLKKLRALSIDLCSSADVAPVLPTLETFPELRMLSVYFETVDMSLTFLR